MHFMKPKFLNPPKRQTSFPSHRGELTQGGRHPLGIRHTREGDGLHGDAGAEEFDPGQAGAERRVRSVSVVAPSSDRPERGRAHPPQHTQHASSHARALLCTLALPCAPLPHTPADNPSPFAPVCRLKEHLRQKLIDSGWRDQLKEYTMGESTTSSLACPTPMRVKCIQASVHPL